MNPLKAEKEDLEGMHQPRLLRINQSTNMDGQVSSIESVATKRIRWQAGGLFCFVFLNNRKIMNHFILL